MKKHLILILALLISATPLWMRVALSYNGDVKKITVNKTYAGARGEDSDDSLEAYARVRAEKDTWFEWPPQIPGVECQADASVSGRAHDGYEYYGGLYSVNADAYTSDGNRDTPSYQEWQGDIDHDDTRSEAKAKDTSVDDLDAVIYYNYLSFSVASAWITGDYPEESLQHSDTSGAIASAKAFQFGYDESVTWDCYNCNTPQCAKCGG